MNEEYAKAKAEILAKLQSGDISAKQAADQLTSAIGKHKPTDGSAIADMQNLIGQFPSLGTYLSQKAADAQAGEAQGKFATGLRVLSDLGMTAASLSQIAAGKQAAQGLVKPGLAAVPGQNPQLTQALYEAQRGVVNPNAVLDPAKQQIAQGYQNAILQNQMTSGGQASSLQAMNQAANLQRMQASLGLAPLAQDVKVQNQGNFNNLMGQRLQETQNNFQNRASNADQAYNQYWNSAQAAGAAQASGRQNLLDATQRLSEHLGNYQINAQGVDPVHQSIATGAPDWARNPGFAAPTKTFDGFDPNNFVRNAFAEHALRNAQNRYGAAPSLMDQNYYRGFNQNGIK